MIKTVLLKLLKDVCRTNRLWHIIKGKVKKSAKEHVKMAEIVNKILNKFLFHSAEKLVMMVPCS